ncbi:MAG: hypothetical protein AB7H80_14245 [Candidatus Kapaibacterium sp.]
MSKPPAEGKDDVSTKDKESVFAKATTTVLAWQHWRGFESRMSIKDLNEYHALVLCKATYRVDTSKSEWILMYIYRDSAWSNWIVYSRSISASIVHLGNNVNSDSIHTFVQKWFTSPDVIFTLNPELDSNGNITKVITKQSCQFKFVDGGVCKEAWEEFVGTKPIEVVPKSKLRK